jgi:arylsulfatase
LLKALDELGIGNDTIVIYTTDNGPRANSWPDGATTPFRSEKNTKWKGAFRVPCMIRCLGESSQIKCRTKSSAGSTGCRR